MEKLISLVLVAIAIPSGVYTFEPPQIPLNWTTQYACAIDTPERVIAGDVTTQNSDNTPATCIERCDAGNFIYAGVEFSNECHCGTGLVGTIQAAPASDCDLACSGDPTLSCGGSFRIQIYKSPALGPGGWALQGCYMDTTTSPAFGQPVVHQTFPSNFDLISQCTSYCQHIGFLFSGVEDGSDCQCSFALASGAHITSLSDCNSLCPLPGGAGNEFCGGFQRLEVYEFQPRS